MAEDIQTGILKAMELKEKCAAQEARIAELIALARSAEDDCQRAITRSQKADLDLKCLQESTVDSKAYDAANKRIAELEAALKELDACMDFNEEVQPGEMGIESPENINAAFKKAAALIAQQEQSHD